MGASDSRPAEAGEEDKTVDRGKQFVLVMTAPAGVGKEQLMGTFIAENVHDVAYVAKIGAVRANEPGLIYFYESIADAKAESSQEDSWPTILQAAQAALQDGKSVIADVTTAAVRALRASNVPACYVFVLPASMQSLRENIAASLQDPAAGEIDRAVSASEKEILAADEEGLYDFSIQNDNHAAALELFANLAREHGKVAAEVLSIPTATTLHTSSLNTSRAASATATPTAPPTAVTPDPSLGATGERRTPPRAPPLPGYDAPMNDHHAESAVPAPDDLVMPPGLERWRGCIAVVTGAGAGVGAVVCEALVAAGVRVVAAARSKERLQALQARVLASGASGRMFLPCMCDSTREEEVRSLMSIAVKTFEGKPVSLLINASGIQSEDARVLDGTSRSWVEMLSNNVLAVTLCCREACTSMQRADSWGHIVTLSSSPGSDEPGDAFSRATTAAMRSICQGLRQEAVAAGHPLRVSMITAPKMVSADGDTALEPQNETDGPGLSVTDIANSILHVVSQPPHVDVSEVELRSCGHPSR